MLGPRAVPSARVGPPGTDCHGAASNASSTKGFCTKGGKGYGKNIVAGQKGCSAGEQRSSPYGRHALGPGVANPWAVLLSSSDDDDDDEDDSDGVSSRNEDLTAGAAPLLPPAACRVGQQIFFPECFHSAHRCVRADQVVTTGPPLLQFQQRLENCSRAADPSPSAIASASAAAPPPPGAGLEALQQQQQQRAEAVQTHQQLQDQTEAVLQVAHANEQPCKFQMTFPRCSGNAQQWWHGRGRIKTCQVCHECHRRLAWLAQQDYTNWDDS